MAASGLTWLQLINRVLPRLREGTVAANDSTTYSAYIGSLINAVKSEIEDAYRWNALRDTYSVTAVPGTTNYVLTDAEAHATIIDGWNTTTATRLGEGTNADFNGKFFGVAVVQTGATEQYLVAGVDANHDLRIDIWPAPSSTNILKFNVYVPQADLAADATVARVPQSLLIEEVIARALVERGDDGSQPMPAGQSFIRYDLLASAVAREAGYDQTEMDWEPE